MYGILPLYMRANLISYKSLNSNYILKGVVIVCNPRNLEAEVEESGLAVELKLPSNFQASVGFIWRLSFKNKQTKEKY
jgi:hypothetical protein